MIEQLRTTLSAPLPPSHRLDESQLIIPRRVSLQQCPPPLHQPVSSSPQPAATVNLHPQSSGGFFDRRNAEISTGVNTLDGEDTCCCIASQPQFQY